MLIKHSDYKIDKNNFRFNLLFSICVFWVVKNAISGVIAGLYLQFGDLRNPIYIWRQIDPQTIRAIDDAKGLDVLQDCKLA